jgi:hypothetical protein
MNATASPKTLYSERNALNSFKNPDGFGDGGGGSNAFQIFFNSSRISLSLSKMITYFHHNNTSSSLAYLENIFPVIFSNDA